MRTLKILIFTVIIGVSNCIAVYAQDESEPIVLPALLQLPEIPDNLTEISDRYSYFVQHYWDNFDFKQNAVGQIQLDDAFDQYATALRFTQSDIAFKSVDALLKKLDKNSTLLYQFCVSAENNMYNPERAEVLVDGVYLKFLEAIAKNKKLKPERKVRFASQYNQLKGSIVGTQPASFNFEDRIGVNTTYTPEARKTVLIFGHPDCADCMMAKIKLEMDTELDAKCRDGELRIYFIIPDKDMPNWKEMVEDYPHYWVVGASDSVDDIYDLRFNPTIYVLGADRKVEMKSGNIENVIKSLK